MSDLQVELEGLDELQAKFEKFPTQVARNLSQAGHEAGTEVLDTKGLRRYPPATAANKPPTPYYIRGRGTQYASGNRGGSERLGTQFYIKRIGYNTEIGNPASYAKWVVGEQQASAMAPKGWRKLFDVATEKLPKIQKIFQAWIDKTLREVGL